MIKPSALAFIFCLLPCLLYSQEVTGDLYGYVYSQNNKQPLSGCVLSLDGRNDSVITDLQGAFSWDSLTVGDYSGYINVITYLSAAM